MVGPRSWIGGIFSRSGNRRYGSEKFTDYPLSHLQEERLQRLQERFHVPFDETYADHQEALRALWVAAFPNVALRGLISEQWKDMGWQGHNPSTDFRRGSCEIKVGKKNIRFKMNLVAVFSQPVMRVN
ncbi:ELMO/CED-12 family protein [Actinidia rufa]|uniref:ELMO/CED-12 family protein n=1 Tax=Actinidia rufa TaxID=165716 RepID=A0A7J0DD41_9ERIC|nr:ELMO/CED-12 family protein [Actinidia rufa]